MESTKVSSTTSSTTTTTKTISTNYNNNNKSSELLIPSLLPSPRSEQQQQQHHPNNNNVQHQQVVVQQEPIQHHPKRRYNTRGSGAYVVADSSNELTSTTILPHITTNAVSNATTTTTTTVIAVPAPSPIRIYPSNHNLHYQRLHKLFFYNENTLTTTTNNEEQEQDDDVISETVQVQDELQQYSNKNECNNHISVHNTDLSTHNDNQNNCYSSNRILQFGHIRLRPIYYQPNIYIIDQFLSRQDIQYFFTHYINKYKFQRSYVDDDNDDIDNVCENESDDNTNVNRTLEQQDNHHIDDEHNVCTTGTSSAGIPIDGTTKTKKRRNQQTSSNNNKRRKYNPHRTSTFISLNKQHDRKIAAIEQKIASLFGCSNSTKQIEAFQLVRYEMKSKKKQQQQFFHIHHDLGMYNPITQHVTLPNKSIWYHRRLCTIFCYLNTVPTQYGGATYFPNCTKSEITTTTTTPTKTKVHSQDMEILNSEISLSSTSSSYIGTVNKEVELKVDNNQNDMQCNQVNEFLVEIASANVSPVEIVGNESSNTDYKTEKDTRTAMKVKNGNNADMSNTIQYDPDGLRIYPVAGRAIVFPNILSSGLPDPRTIHAGEPLRPSTAQGDDTCETSRNNSDSNGIYKYGLNIWICES